MTHNPTATRDPHTPGPLCGTQFVRLHPHILYVPGNKRVHSIHTRGATPPSHTYPQSTAACDPRNIPPLILTALHSRS